VNIAQVFQLMACLDGDTENLSKAELVAGQLGDFKTFEQIETDGDGLIQVSDPALISLPGVGLALTVVSGRRSTSGLLS